MSLFSTWILALDFDGVIWDSVGECYMMAGRAYQEMHGRAASAHEGAFRCGRWMVRCGGDFLLLLELSGQHSPEELMHFSRDRFQALQASRADELKRFELIFYRLRSEARQKETSAWLSCQAPYGPFLAQFPQLRSAFKEVVVCTTKDEASARQLLATAGLDMRIWGREKGVDKGQQIHSLCQHFAQAPENVLFIDDLVENLDQVHPAGCPCFLAAWGYNTLEEEKRATALGYPILHIDDLLPQLESWLESRANWSEPLSPG